MIEIAEDAFPIEVATALIKATRKLEIIGGWSVDAFSKEELKEIAYHLLVYAELNKEES